MGDENPPGAARPRVLITLNDGGVGAIWASATVDVVVQQYSRESGREVAEFTPDGGALATVEVVGPEKLEEIIHLDDVEYDEVEVPEDEVGENGRREAGDDEEG